MTVDVFFNFDEPYGFLGEDRDVEVLQPGGGLWRGRVKGMSEKGITLFATSNRLEVGEDERMNTDLLYTVFGPRPVTPTPLKSAQLLFLPWLSVLSVRFVGLLGAEKELLERVTLAPREEVREE